MAHEITGEEAVEILRKLYKLRLRAKCLHKKDPEPEKELLAELEGFGLSPQQAEELLSPLLQELAEER